MIPGGGGPWLPFGMSGIFKSLPFAIWFFLAIEEVPLAAEESMDPRRDVPKGSVLAMHTLLIAAVLTLVFNTALPGGAFLYGTSGFPLLDGFKAIFGSSGKLAYIFGCLFMIGLIASFFTIIFAYGRNTYSLSRAGYFPRFLSRTHGDAEDAARGSDRRRGRRIRGRDIVCKSFSTRRSGRRSWRRC